MVKATELDARIRALEDTEAIRRLKCRYWNSLDRKLVDGVVICFSEEASVDYGPNRRFEGLEGARQFYRQLETLEHVTTTHEGHDPEIELLNDTEARARWSFHDRIADSQAKTTYRGWGFYEDEYVKEVGRWRIRNSRIARTHRDISTGQDH
jgi:hypothetical protein